MIKREFQIVNKLGMHARASALFVKTTSRFNSEVKVTKGSIEVNGKSIMGIMMLVAAHGSNISIVVEGEDEIEAMNKISELVTSGFNEE